MRLKIIVREWVEIPLISAFIFMSAVPAMAAESNPNMGWRLIDVVIFAAIIIYFTRKPIANFFRNRKLSIEQSIKKSDLSIADAKNDLKNADDNYSKIDAAIAEIESLYAKKAEVQKEAILKKARESSIFYKQNAEELSISEEDAAKKLLLINLFHKIERDVVAHLSTPDVVTHGKINKKVIANLRTI